MKVRSLAVIAMALSVRSAHAGSSEEGTRLRNIGEFALAADAFERFVREDPANENAPRALSDAIVLRLGLGDDRKAEDDAELYLRNYATRTEDAAKVSLAMLLHAGEKEDWAAVEREAPRKMPLIEKGPLSLSMQAHAVLAHAYASHRDARASREWARVRDLAQRLPPPAGDSEKMTQWARGADVFGEALVFAADEKRDATTWATFPAYTGGDVGAWLTTKVSAWMIAREASIRAVSDEYKKVTEIQPVAPPRWTIEASARVARLWIHAIDEMRAPAGHKKDLEPTLRTLRDLRAKPAAILCVELSAKFEWTNEATHVCAAWLEKTYRREFPPLDELLVAPALRSANPIVLSPAR